MANYKTLDTISQKEFYCVSIEDTVGGVGYDEVFPTLIDAVGYAYETLNTFIESGVDANNIDLVFCKYYLTDEEFNELNGSVCAFFDNMFEYEHIMIAS